MAEFTNVTGTFDGEKFRFRCPGCPTDFAWAADQVTNIADESIADYCGNCGIGLRVWKPGVEQRAAHTQPIRERQTLESGHSPATSIAAAQNRYKVLPFIGQTRGTLSATDVATQLQVAINAQAAEGWEFYQLADVNIEVQPGCLAGFFGAKVQYVRFDQLIFKAGR